MPDLFENFSESLQPSMRIKSVGKQASVAFLFITSNREDRILL